MVTKRKADRTFDQTRKYNEYMRNYQRKKALERKRTKDLPVVDEDQPSQEVLDVLAQAAARIKSRPT